MRSRLASFFVLIIPLVFCAQAMPRDQADEDPIRKLGAFFGTWNTEASFANGEKVTSELECRWSPQKQYLICEQQVKMASGQSHQLTVYSYNAKGRIYSYTTFQDNGAMPATGSVEINGSTWVYNSSFERDGKKTQVRNTNHFTNPRTEEFRVETSDDGGATWKMVLQGSAQRTGA